LQPRNVNDKIESPSREERSSMTQSSDWTVPLKAERTRLDGVATDERNRQDRVADEKRERLDRRAVDERTRLGPEGPL